MKPHDDLAPESELQTLRDIAVHRPVIEQAKGMVMLSNVVDEHAAFTVLREISQRTNTKLYDVAAVIVATGSNTTADLDDEAAAAVLTQAREAGLGGPFAELENFESDQS
ncbi:ANTAR domain-containing protein [Lentzea cavernae]|uniref:ANTAR domain-containing protein n=1 Tax=Lentzea cavernae TaxID=2020703 RepID=UPI001E29226C|nr:ANTAR domain-containing protein [Lentzea cavernae]